MVYIAIRYIARWSGLVQSAVGLTAAHRSCLQLYL